MGSESRSLDAEGSNTNEPENGVPTVTDPSEMPSSSATEVSVPEKVTLAAPAARGATRATIANKSSPAQFRRIRMSSSYEYAAPAILPSDAAWRQEEIRLRQR